VFAPGLHMKMVRVVLLLAMVMISASLCAQQARYAFASHAYVTHENLAASRFWTPATIALVALDGAAKTADSFATRENLDRGGEEYDPMARPFVHTPVVQVAAMAALFGAEITTSYMLHQRGHDRVARAILVMGATMNGLGAASSFKNRVSGW
jgi:hypothetical protein